MENLKIVAMVQSYDGKMMDIAMNGKTVEDIDKKQEIYDFIIKSTKDIKDKYLYENLYNKKL